VVRETQTIRVQQDDDEENQQLAYKDMSASQYYGLTLLMYGLIILGACFIDNLGVILGFVASLSISGISFFFPSVFYHYAAKRAQAEVSTFMSVNKWANFMMGMFVFCLGMYSNIKGIVTGSGGGH
jgi:hypothetical protein